LPVSADRETVAVLGSHDLALEALARQLGLKKSFLVDLLILPVGSLEGLIALRQGVSQLAGCHLLDADSGEYNLPYVRHIFPDRDVSLLTLAYREQGLMVSPGNPQKIHSLQDLSRQDVTMVNRNRGSGTRLWLDHQLAQISLSPQEVRGYSREVRTHTAVAEAIRQGKADTGLGLMASARQHGLDFIPLFQERFDLAIPQEQIENQRLQPLLDFLQSAEFRHIVRGLEGYDTAHTGDQLRP
jgi:putative molybdopterin biosynthesis protein